MSLSADADALLGEAAERGLTPQAWWFGRSRHDALVDELGSADEGLAPGGRLTEFRGLPVKVLDETPQRFGLWCAEGLLEL